MLVPLGVLTLGAVFARIGISTTALSGLSMALNSGRAASRSMRI
jgi:hypothetical protein